MSYLAGQLVTAAELNANTIQQLYTTTLIGAQTSAVLPVPTGSAYNFLIVKWRTRSSTATTAEGFNVQFNADSGSNYLWENLQGRNAGAASGNTSAGATTKIQVATICAASATANYFSSGNFEIGGASDTTNFKTLSGAATTFTSATDMWVGTFSGQWNSAAAVTSITLSATGNLVTGSIFTLFGSG